MSSTTNPQPDLPADEELVAYLDGELSPEDCRLVEQRLAADENYRRQLRDLDQSWEALDALPAAKADDDFARTTMELVTVAAQGEVSKHGDQAAAAHRRRMRWLAAAGISAVIVGFFTARALLRRGDERLLADLPVIHKVDLLAHVDDIEFLRELPSATLDQLTSDDAAVNEELENFEWVGAQSRSARREWIDALSPDEKAQLASQAARFDNLPADEQQRLRTLEREISQSAELQRTLLAYGQWIARLTPGEQEQLREELWGLPAGEQATRLSRFVRQVNERASRRLSIDEQERLRTTILQIAKDRTPAFLRERRRDDGREPRQLVGSPARVALVILGWELRNDGRDNRTLEQLVDQLRPESREHLERLGRGGRRLQLWQWIRDAMQPELGPNELERFFADERKLTHDQRARLLDLPASQMQAELESLYFASELGFGDADQWWTVFGEPGRRPEPPPRDWRTGPPPPGPFERNRFDRRDGRRPPIRPEPPRGPPPPDEKRPEAI